MGLVFVEIGEYNIIKKRGLAERDEGLTSQPSPKKNEKILS